MGTTPVLLTLNLRVDDDAQRQQIRTGAPLPTTMIQRVIVQDSREADRIAYEFMRRSLTRGFPCGGWWQDRAWDYFTPAQKMKFGPPTRWERP